MKMDVCECYCAASLWNSSGLLPEPKSREKIARRLGLRKDEPARVGKAFEELLHLQKPWMQGREGTDGEWERHIFEALQLEVLGRFIFSMFLAYIRKKVKREPSGSLDGFKLLFEAIRQWDADTPAKKLEQQFLLKELSIGRRNEHLPSWSGGALWSDGVTVPSAPLTEFELLQRSLVLLVLLCMAQLAYFRGRLGTL
jgi:hypothetical protein